MVSPRPLILIATVSMAALMAMPQVAAAKDAPYGYANIAVEVIELESLDSTALGGFIFPEVATTAVFRGGAVVHEYFAIEGEAAIGVSNEDGDGIPNYNERFAGFGRARYVFGQTGLEVFARAGYAVTTIESSNVIGDGTMDGIAYGAGVIFNFGQSDRFQLRLDYSEFNFGNNQDADAVSLGLGYNF